ncbi:ABC transporter ATP-binding protein [bacterium]|nr:ABC transporter ATP-binding protein [bacterium]
MAELILTGLSKAYRGGPAAVVDFSLSVRDGERVVLLGPSGCGKTTLLRLIAGLEKPDAGQVHIGGRRVDGSPPHRRGVAMLFQESALYPHLTVEDNLGFGLRLAGVNRQERRRRAREAAEWLGLTDLLSRRPGTLSGGEAQRVALGRALARRPEVLLLDEPLSHLDAPLREELIEELLRLHARAHTTMLLVTHDRREALALGQRIALQRDGRLVQVGAPADLLAQPTCLFVAEFLGLPRANIRAGRLAMDDGAGFFSCPEGRLPLSAPRAGCRDGREVILAVPPQRITPADGGEGTVPARFIESREHGGEGTWKIEAFGSTWLMRAPGGPAPAPGERLFVTFQPDSAFFFDASTGSAVSIRELGG